MTRRIHRVLALIPLLGSVGAPARSQCVDYAAHFFWDGYTALPTGFSSEHVLAGRTLFLMGGAGSVWFADVVDLSDPARPRHLLRTVLHVDTTRAVSPDSVHVQASSSDVIVMDVSRPLNPAIVRRLTIAGRLGHALQRGFLYVSVHRADGTYALQTWDMHDPRFPQLLRERQLTRRSSQVVAMDGFLAIKEHGGLATGTGFVLFDLVDPADPRERGRVSIGSGVRDLAGLKRTVYVPYDGSIRMYDISNPDLPRLIRIETTSGAELRLHGDLLFAGGTPTSPWIKVWDLSDPMNPSFFGDIAPRSYTYGRFVVGDRIGLLSGLGVFTAERARTRAGLIGPQGAVDFSGVRDVAAAGTRAFTAPGMHILDVSDPGSLRIVGDFPIAAVAEDVCTADGLVFFALGNQGLMIADVDVADPSDPTRRSWTAFGVPITAVESRNGIAALATAGAEVLVADVSVPEWPQIIGVVDLPYVASGLAMAEGRLYATHDSRLSIVDLSAPASPSLCATMALPAVPTRVRASVGRCLVTGGFGVVSVNTADCGAPVIDGTWSVGPAHDVVADGPHALIATPSQVLVVDPAGDPLGIGALYSASGTVEHIVPAAAGFLAHTNTQVFFVPGQCASTAIPETTRPATPGAALPPGRPNPFFDRTELHFSLPERGTFRLAIHDVAGRLVRTVREGHGEAGSHRAEWDGRDRHGTAVASGTYFVVLSQGGSSSRSKIVRLR